MSHLLITIDVECDKRVDWTVQTPITFRAVVEAIPDVLQPAFARWDIRPTWLLSPEVLRDDDSMACLLDLTACELGTHLHAEFIEPGARRVWRADDRTSIMQCELAREVEAAKLAALTELFVERVGARPTSFRAGRFGVGPHSGQCLVDLGYQVDSSVTPHLRWRDSTRAPGPDFSRCPTRPYRVDGDLFRPGRGPLWEVPVTVLDPQRLTGARPMWPGSLDSDPVWFRPWYADADTLRRVVETVATEEPGRPLVMMFHNVELVANASPYTRSAADVARYVDLLEVAFEAAAAHGFEPATLSEYATVLDGRGEP